MKAKFWKGLLIAIIGFVASVMSTKLTFDGVMWAYIGISVGGIVLTYFAQNAILKPSSEFGDVNGVDLMKGLLMAVGTAITAFAAGVLTVGAVNWNELGIAVLSTTLMYLSKNVLSNSDGDVMKVEKPKKGIR